MWSELWGAMVWGGAPVVPVFSPFGIGVLILGLLLVGLTMLSRGLPRWVGRITAVIVVVVGAPIVVAAVTVPHMFENGEVADAIQVNENFEALSAAVDDVVGGSFDSGWLPVSANQAVTVQHGLGTSAIILNVRFSPTSNDTGLVAMPPIQHHEDASNRTEGGGVVALTDAAITLRFANVIYRGPTSTANTSGDFTSGFVRIVAFAP